MSARGAGVLGMMRYGHRPQFMLDESGKPNHVAVKQFLQSHGSKPFFIFGFTFMVWSELYEQFANQNLDLSNGILVHSGGWKKMEEKAVDAATFRNQLHESFGLEKIYNFYGMVEQIGSIFLEGDDGLLFPPNFSDVIVRDPESWKPCEVGQEGLIQVLSLIPRSYPGHSLLTEDLGVVEKISTSGPFRGKGLRILGRVKKAELRGCSDVIATENSSISVYVQSKIVEKDERAFLESIESLSTDLREPFSDDLVGALATLSKTILTAELARSQPQLMALGYWLRPAAVKQLKAQFESNHSDGVAVARGMAFHIPPANVDTLFAYSWALSFLVGNSNVTRVSSELNPVAVWLLEQITVALSLHNHNARQVFCSYDKSGELGGQISSYADLRVIWGGDAKIAEISRSPTRPDGLTLGFSDRNSLCLIKTAAFDQLDRHDRLALAEKLYNDIYWFDQMGCGSPRVVVWVGDTPPQVSTLYNDLIAVLKARQHVVESGTDVSKFVFANTLLATGVSDKAVRYSAELLVLDSPMQSTMLANVHGGGVLHQTHIDAIDALEPLITRQLQTLTTYGFTTEEKVALAKQLNGRGGYRIVPIGDALSFSSVWDGVDLLKHFSRYIPIR